MMKNFVKSLGIVAFVAMVGVSFVACEGLADVLPVLGGSVSITGTTEAGKTLTANTSALNGNGTISYQWKVSGENVMEETNNIYIIRTSDVGLFITLTVTCSGNSGEVTSEPVGPVTDIAPVNTAGITLGLEQIADKSLEFGNITISRTGTGFPATYPVSVNVSDFDLGSIRWEVAGVGIFSGETVIGNSQSFTLDASDVRYNSLGGHTLTLTLTKDGLQYRKAIPFTIMQ